MSISNEPDWVKRWLKIYDYTPLPKGKINEIEFLCANNSPEYVNDFISTLKKHLYLQQRFKNSPDVLVYRKFYPPNTYSCLALALTPKGEAEVLREASRIELIVDQIEVVYHDVVDAVHKRKIKGII